MEHIEDMIYSTLNQLENPKLARTSVYNDIILTDKDNLHILTDKDNLHIDLISHRTWKNDPAVKNTH